MYVILGMTWLSPNFAILDCNAKTVTLAKPGTDPLVWEGDYISTPVRIISFICEEERWKFSNVHRLQVAE